MKQYEDQVGLPDAAMRESGRVDIDRLSTPTGYASFHPHSASPRRTAPRQPPTMDSFFRPWTLCVGDMLVPHFSLFGMDSKVLQGWYAACGEPMTERPLCSLERLARKSKPEAVSELMSWKNAWDHYVAPRGTETSSP